LPYCFFEQRKRVFTCWERTVFISIKDSLIHPPSQPWGQEEAKQVQENKHSRIFAKAQASFGHDEEQAEHDIYPEQIG
jgi:hypothetical protein